MTLDDLDLKKVTKALGGDSRSILNTIHVVPSPIFHFDTAALSGEVSNDIQKYDVCPDL